MTIARNFIDVGNLGGGFSVSLCVCNRIKRRTAMKLRKIRTALTGIVMTLAVLAASTSGWLVVPADAGISARGAD